MATPMTADQLIAALRKWKVRYREYPGWRDRGRPGGIIDARGIVLHHTGSNSQSDDYLNFLFVRGRPEDNIPGPLCNVATDLDGDLHLGAIGRANHAGSGSSTTMNHVMAEDYDGYRRELQPGPDGVNGNAYYYGNEVRYDGARAMSDAAYRTSILYAAAVCDFHGWSALSVIGHREHTNRKDDPGYCPMYRFRSDLAVVLRVGPDVTWSGKTPTEDDMSAADVQAIKDYIDAKFAATFSSAGTEGQRYAALQNGVSRTVETLDEFVRVMQGRYSRGEDLAEADAARDAAQMAALAPLQVLKDHEDVDDALVQTKLDELSAALTQLQESVSQLPKA